jgi:hypothetical protein
MGSTLRRVDFTAQRGFAKYYYANRAVISQRAECRLCSRLVVNSTSQSKESAEIAHGTVA